MHAVYTHISIDSEIWNSLLNYQDHYLLHTSFLHLEIAFNSFLHLLSYVWLVSSFYMIFILLFNSYGLF